ncbi:MAG TPA: PHP domain-containing protein [Treponemataceae bacterium]|jgi:3',5'-nucleoside bisphosphate phosphatase|nr:PHP domain-containing protein [Treponemataceae bacterium]HQL05145.1 PHP domain-containing protein [Treponemataceae bacterium]
MIDLHSHSTASDGSLSPSELVSYAASKGVTVLALTDHDTLDGLAECGTACKNSGITFVPGVELNIDWPTGEFHLLGLSLKAVSPSLTALLKDLQESRIERNRKIVETMNNDGIPVSFEALSKHYDTKSLGRPHIADFLVKNKIVKTAQQAFDRFLGKGRPYYVGRQGLDLDEAISAIVDSGGIPVLAHPMSLYVSWGKIEPVLTDLFARGIKGLEAWHPGARVAECMRLEEMGRKLGFFITAGSDFHGEQVRKDRKIGHTAGMKKIDNRFWTEELEPAVNGKKG